MNEMTQSQAIEMDKGSVFVEEEDGMWGVFGTESGFCYRLECSEEAARNTLTGRPRRQPCEDFR